MDFSQQGAEKEYIPQIDCFGPYVIVPDWVFPLEEYPQDTGVIRNGPLCFLSDLNRMST